MTIQEFKDKYTLKIGQQVMAGEVVHDISQLEANTQKCVGSALKMRWHDLRKDPEDLPDAYMPRQIMFAWHGSDGCDWYSCGWFYKDLQEPKPYFSIMDAHMFVGDGFREVFAWKEIEPIEEETE